MNWEDILRKIEHYEQTARNFNTMYVNCLPALEYTRGILRGLRDIYERRAKEVRDQYITSGDVLR